MIDAFLAAHGYAAARAEPLPADASFRRYTRLIGGPAPALLMHAPPPEDIRPFSAIARHLAAAGLPAPDILAEDAVSGLLLVEDFGRLTMADLLDAGAAPDALYRSAARTLAALHAVPPMPGLPGWGVAEMQRATAATLLDWWWPAAMGAPPAPDIRIGLDAALAAMLAPFAATGLVHRDYFPANLMPLEGRMGLLDFQDSAVGNPIYDLVSLVEDARRDVPDALRHATIEQYREVTGAADLDAAIAVHAAQRHLRVAALWVRLDRRDGRPRYLQHGPRCWALLARALRHPATSPLRDFLDRHVPAARRANP